MTAPNDLPSLTALQAFEASLRHRSFTRAAEELYRTQGAISRQVAALEKDLGVVLFHRSHHQLRPTPAAVAFGKTIRTVLERLAEAVEATRQSRAEGASLHVATLPSFGTRWLTPRLGHFYAAHPDLTVHLSTRIQSIDFETEEFDLAIGHGTGNWPGAHLEPLMPDRVRLVTSREFQAEHQLAEPADLVGIPLLRLESRVTGWSQWFKAMGLPPESGRSGPRFEHQLMVLEAAVAGLGAALLPTFLVQPELDAGRLVSPLQEVPVDTGLSYWLGWPPRSRDHSGAQAFRAWLHAQVNDQRLT